MVQGYRPSSCPGPKLDALAAEIADDGRGGQEKGIMRRYGMMPCTEGAPAV
jgi:hypothetical protein